MLDKRWCVLQKKTYNDESDTDSGEGQYLNTHLRVRETSQEGMWGKNIKEEEARSAKALRQNHGWNEVEHRWMFMMILLCNNLIALRDPKVAHKHPFWDVYNSFWCKD